LWWSWWSSAGAPRATGLWWSFLHQIAVRTRVSERNFYNTLCLYWYEPRRAPSLSRRALAIRTCESNQQLPWDVFQMNF
jgi:hypothetical protein